MAYVNQAAGNSSRRLFVAIATHACSLGLIVVTK